MEQGKEDELKRLSEEENAVCATLSKLEHFIKEATRSSTTSLSDAWGAWNPLDNGAGEPCYKIKGCNHNDCEAFNVASTKCWLLDGTSCSKECSSYAQKIGKCFDCEVVERLRANTPGYLNELISILIKFLMIRDKELVNIAIHDALTGLYNRHYFDEYISHETFTAERHAESMSFMMIDLDKFKEINDKFGHAAGDKVLVTVANILTKAVRAGDMVFRFGGDEFLLVFPRTECCGVISIRDRIHELLGDYNSRNTELGTTRVTLSIGCATWKPGDDVLAKLIEADKSMYMEKRG